MKNLHILPTDKPSRLFKDDFGKLIYSINMDQEQNHFEPQHLFITSDEEIKFNEYVIQVNFEKTNTQVIRCTTEFQVKIANDEDGSFTKKKIILTTDQDLIKDGVQAIDDKFLEWFVKNPSCENVKVELIEEIPSGFTFGMFGNDEPPTELVYKIIIPKEEQCTCKEHDPYCCQIHGNCPTCVKKEKPKQETPEEAAERLYPIPKGGSIWNPSEDDCIKANKQEGFIEGTKWQAERMYSEEDLKRAFEAGHKKGFSGYPNTENWKELPFEKWFEQFKKK
jgi:hypothetical protein